MEIAKLTGFKNKRKMEEFMNETDGLYVNVQKKLKKMYYSFGYDVLKMFDKHEFNVFEYVDMPVTKQHKTKPICEDCCIRSEEIRMLRREYHRVLKENNKLKNIQ